MAIASPHQNNERQSVGHHSQKYSSEWQIIVLFRWLLWWEWSLSLVAMLPLLYILPLCRRASSISCWLNQLKLIQPNVVHVERCPVLTVSRPHRMAESYPALNLPGQYRAAVLVDAFSVWPSLHELTNLSHDALVKRLKQHLVAPPLFSVLEILKNKGQRLPFTLAACADPYWQHLAYSSFKFHNLIMVKNYLQYPTTPRTQQVRCVYIPHPGL